MKKQLSFHDKAMDVSISEDAINQCAELASPLIIEIQIYFSCLLGKRLAFYTEHKLKGAWQVEQEQFASMLSDALQLHENVYVRFNTVMTKDCPVSDYVGPPPVTDFTIKNQKPYVPSWLKIDFSDGLWSGHYGWPASAKKFANTKQVRAQAMLAENISEEIDGVVVPN